MTHDVPLWEKLKEMGLTDRQAECTMYACQGYINRDIGTKMRIHRQTVKVHIHDSCERLNVNSRYELMIRAAQEMISDMKWKVLDASDN